MEGSNTMANEEKVRLALGGVLTNLSNYPLDVQGQLWGRSMSEVIDKAVEAVMESGVVEKVDTMHEKPLVNRVEVIDPWGRAYVNMDAVDVGTALQDGGKTLKVFVGERL